MPIDSHAFVENSRDSPCTRCLVSPSGGILQSCSDVITKMLTLTQGRWGALPPPGSSCLPSGATARWPGRGYVHLLYFSTMALRILFIYLFILGCDRL